MKRKLLPFALMVSAVVAFSSCLSDNEEAEYYDDAALTSFSVTSLNRYYHYTSKAGTDSVSRKAYAPTTLYFYIDQVNHKIYNPDSLPYGCDVSKVLCAINAKNGGAIALKSMKSDSLRMFSAKDSIDFTQPRQLYVYSNSGKTSASYTVTVNVHKQDGSVFNWNGAAVANATLAAMTAMKEVEFGGKMYVFGVKDGASAVVSASLDNFAAWTAVQTSPALDAEAYKSVTVKGAYLYTLNAGKVLRSADGATWETVGAASLRQLVGAGNTKLYAIGDDGKLMSSADGASWAPDAMDADAALLPDGNINMVSMPLKTNADASRLLLVGTTATDARVWGKIEEKDAKAQMLPWTYYVNDATNRFALPNLENLQVSPYKEGVLAFGGKGMGSSSKVEAFKHFYYTADGGITWKNDSIALPSGFATTASPVAMHVDSRNFIWLVCGKTGQVWHGRLNRLGWKKEQDIFKE